MEWRQWTDIDGYGFSELQCMLKWTLETSVRSTVAVNRISRVLRSSLFSFSRRITSSLSKNAFTVSKIYARLFTDGKSIQQQRDFNRWYTVNGDKFHKLEIIFANYILKVPFWHSTPINVKSLSADSSVRTLTKGVDDRQILAFINYSSSLFSHCLLAQVSPCVL